MPASYATPKTAEEGEDDDDDKNLSLTDFRRTAPSGHYRESHTYLSRPAPCLSDELHLPARRHFAPHLTPPSLSHHHNDHESAIAQDAKPPPQPTC